MYYRSQGYRYPKNMNIPPNYSGNAFFEENSSEKEKSLDENYVSDEATQITTEFAPELPKEIPETIESNTPDKPESTQEATKNVAPTSLFGNFTSKSFLSRIGSEELLILALVFLLSDTDSDNDIIWLLLLLLFIK